MKSEIAEEKKVAYWEVLGRCELLNPKPWTWVGLSWGDFQLQRINQNAVKHENSKLNNTLKYLSDELVHEL
jgi:hypothetical protein